jgi:hypothetical protein
MGEKGRPGAGKASQLEGAAQSPRKVSGTGHGAGGDPGLSGEGASEDIGHFW